MKAIQTLIQNHKLTRVQSALASYILDHAVEVCFMSSTKLAKQLGISEPSVIRFCRVLGFSGYPDFQKALREEYHGDLFRISDRLPVPSDRAAALSRLDLPSDILANEYQNTLGNLEQTLASNRPETLDAAADLILSSVQKYIVASRGNACLGVYLNLYLHHMTDHVIHTSSASVSPFDLMADISSDDCVIAFSFPRYSSTDELALKLARSAGAKIILFTDKPSALLIEYADLLFTIPVNSTSFFNSMSATQFLTEVLLNTISRKCKGRSIERKLKKIDLYLDEFGTY